MRIEPNVVLAEASRERMSGPIGFARRVQKTAIVDVTNADGTVRKVEVREVASGGDFVASDGTQFSTIDNMPL